VSSGEMAGINWQLEERFWYRELNLKLEVQIGTGLRGTHSSVYN
jgi:hypothetical protein